MNSTMSANEFRKFSEERYLQHDIFGEGSDSAGDVHANLGSGESNVGRDTELDSKYTELERESSTLKSSQENLEESESFVLLLQKLKDPFDYLSSYMGSSLFFNLMKLNFELIADRIARAYLAERQRYGEELPPEIERQFVEALVSELKSAENRIWDYIMWLIDVVEAKKRAEEIPEPPDWMYDIWW